MQKNKSYIWISFIILAFGIAVVPEIIKRVKNGTIVRGDGMDRTGNEKKENENLYKVGAAPTFSLTDQNNQKVDNATFKGKVFVVEFFFSTCPTICPIMNKNLVEVQKAFIANSNFGIASISINPANDTPEVLKKHVEFLKISSPNWHFLTGDRTYIFNLANKGFNLYAGLNPKIVGGFEHSGLFAIIDKKGNIRCRK
ncbi:MAG: SCO family protein, partial [Flavobacterium sp.]|nr:SCO family protein [Flavobacterium sp.]